MAGPSSDLPIHLLFKNGGLEGNPELPEVASGLAPTLGRGVT